MNKFKNIEIDGHKLYLTNGKQWAVLSTCVRNKESIRIIKKRNYVFYYIKKKITINFNHNILL